MHKRLDPPLFNIAHNADLSGRSAGSSGEGDAMGHGFVCGFRELRLAAPTRRPGLRVFGQSLRRTWRLGTLQAKCLDGGVSIEEWNVSGLIGRLRRAGHRGRLRFRAACG